MIMPSSSLQRDPPRGRQQHTPASRAPTASSYSEDYDGPMLDHPDMPSIPPLRIQKSAHPSYRSHPNQQIQDQGPQVWQSSLPILKRVRSILHKPSRLDTSGKKYGAPGKGDIDQRGRTTEVHQPRKNIYDGAFQATRYSPRKYPKAGPRSSREPSPVSVLDDEDVDEYSPPLGWDEDWDPVSPVSVDDTNSQDTPRGLKVASVNPFETPLNPGVKSIKRKPAPGLHSLVPENLPTHDSPTSPEAIDFAGRATDRNPISHFNWTTAAPSPSLNRPSTDTRHSVQQTGELLPASRFSWSTVNTNANMTYQARPVSPPPSPPPEVPSKYKSPPVQSILSRHRPIQRLDREIWTPPRKAVGNPESTKSKLSTTPRASLESGQGSVKKLPPPPDLLTPVTPMSRLEELERQEQDKIHQRRNIQRAIAELAKVESASPLDVSFAEMKEAKKKLDELRKTLEEVRLEEREIGIAIARTRRKEGGEEGLWVRRVTS